ncbi:hypothetical protein SAMN05421665_1234 [Yoonia rosea]|uniref:Uncharacterized protein n=1 Tax=Yoonia rosea TaxID=287098 RepID=A0A1R3WWM2_9RHOB|nr:hypothetical protein [Yoonia rosea]SIT81210.1 hypothetical protein SAMN05421665_1234 [Yoonia rosea]
MTTQTISHNPDGSASTSTGGGRTNSSVDAPQGEGYHVRSGMHGRVTNDLSQVADTDLITVQGMEITYAMAKDMGLINQHKPDTGLSVGNAVPQEAPEVSIGNETEHQGYDATVAELNAQVNAGQLSDREASEYSTALGQVALAGLTVTEVTETLDGLRDGTVNLQDLTQDQRDIVTNLETTVQTASTRSAMSELGQEGFNRIAEIARGDLEFNEVLRGYATMRALGKADHSWPEFLIEAESWSRGER